jgi:hypothetical protein
VAPPGSSPTHILMPENLRELPQLVLALIKNLSFRPGNDIRPDERAYQMSYLR